MSKATPAREGTETREIFMQVIADVLERFAFLFVEADEDKQILQFADDFLHASITFSGKQMGILTVSSPVTLCREMAANVLGISSEDASQGDAEDALKELVNIICGTLTPQLFGDREVFDLTEPRLYQIDRGKWRELVADRENIRLWIEDKPILFNLALAPGNG
jgi:CheY-specific phosphatase CheX